MCVKPLKRGGVAGAAPGGDLVDDGVMQRAEAAMHLRRAASPLHACIRSI